MENCVGNLVKLSPNWKLEISNDQEVDDYLKDNLDSQDYDLLKDKHVVEKLDVWRLIKIYLNGGVYVDIDRLCNKSLDNLLLDSTKMLLPSCGDYDFSHDFMMSSSRNPIFLTALQLNLSRRHQGHDNIYYLGPQTYFHAISQEFLGKSYPQEQNHWVINEVRKLIDQTDFISTYRENLPYDSIIYQSIEHQIFDHELEKRKFYACTNVKHWSQSW